MRVRVWVNFNSNQIMISFIWWRCKEGCTLSIHFLSIACSFLQIPCQMIYVFALNSGGNSWISHCLPKKRMCLIDLIVALTNVIISKVIINCTRNIQTVKLCTKCELSIKVFTILYLEIARLFEIPRLFDIYKRPSFQYHIFRVQRTSCSDLGRYTEASHQNQWDQGSSHHQSIR